MATLIFAARCSGGELLSIPWTMRLVNPQATKTSLRSAGLVGGVLTAGGSYHPQAEQLIAAALV
jgi:hypothetical protein